MTTQELKENLTAQLQNAQATVYQLQGAIAACDELLKPTEEETADE